MLSCPTCGWGIQRCDIPPGGFSCPGCKGRFRLEEFGGGEQAAAVLAGALLALLAPYLLGARGFSVLLFAAILYIPICGALGGLRVFLFPLKLKTDYPSSAVPAEPVGNILHIAERADWNKKKD
jgi:hypothetical protein